MNRSNNIKKQSQPQNQIISGFEGYFSFLSNDYPTWVYYQEMAFPSVTTAFQAARTDDVKIRQKISTVIDTQQFRKIAMNIKNPSDWAQRREIVMTNLIRDKFKRNKQILDKLMSTKDKKLINQFKNGGYNEQFWGVYQGKGKNVLGKILMAIRQQFIKGIDTKQWLENNLNLQTDKNMFPTLTIYIFKDGKKIQKLNFDKNKNYYIFGSLKTVDFHLQNPTISRNHACIYFSDLQVMIVDLKSTHGTFIKRKGQNQKIQLQSLIGYRLYKDDVILFGTSARQYVLDIDRSQIQKYIAEQQHNLKETAVNFSQNKQVQYANLTKQDVKSMLKMDNNCILIQDLPYNQNYHKLKDQFRKFGKIKDVRIKINPKTGKSEGYAVIYFEDHNITNEVINRRKQIPYKIRRINQKEAQQIINKNQQNKLKVPRSKSRSKSKSRQRQRSRQKKQSRRH